MIATPLRLLLGLAAMAAASAEPASFPVSAARMQPTDPWLDYPTRVIGSLPDYQPTSDGQLSRYGGLLAEQRKATGFFYPEKIGSRWWLIDPDGHPFINVGLVDVMIQPNSVAINAALKRQYGDKANWANQTGDFFRANGFNGVGAWSDIATLRAAHRPLVYTAMWDFMGDYGKQRGGTFQQPGHLGYPHDCIFVFEPEFAVFCDHYAQQLAAHADDPWLLGNFSDNELPFYRRTLDNFLKLPSGDPGLIAATRWVEAWRASHSGGADITDPMRDAFLGFVADRYLQITTAAIRKYDPHHLCLGPRFTGQALTSDALFAACGRSLDVIAVNYYHAWSPDLVLTRRWTRLSGKPFLVTEWYAKGMDSGYSNLSGAGYVVKTQLDRGRYYQNFTLGLLESGDCVGWHWFKYMDNDPADLTTDPSNRNANKGIVNLQFKPYGPLEHAMKELNSQVYSLIRYFDGRAGAAAETR